MRARQKKTKKQQPQLKKNPQTNQWRKGKQKQ